MSLYTPGDRVWISMEGADYHWWPARIMSEQEAVEQQLKQNPDSDIFALFYAGSESGVSYTELQSVRDAASICFFETSSEKAVTNNQDLKTAIENAANDDTANPLKATPTPANTRAKTDTRSKKRGRQEAPAVKRVTFRPTLSDKVHSLSQKELLTIVEEINTAVAVSDLDSLRLTLFKLRDVDVTLSDLKETKIGRAVADILGKPECSPLWAVARAIISFWARHLPEETRATIRQLQRSAPRSNTPAATTTNTNTTTTTTTTAIPQSPTQASPTAGKWWESVANFLNDPNTTKPVDPDTIARVVEDIKTTLTDHDDRVLLLERFRKNPNIREYFLSGKWNAHTYLEQPAEVFTTEEEKIAETRRYAERLAAEKAAESANINETNLFTCETCHKNRCHFTEIQMRGGDEPTTKFVKCLECGATWTTE